MPDRYTNVTMESENSFKTSYRELESEMKSLALADGYIYLPNPEPIEPVRHILICMEPSFGRWASSAREAKNKVESGFRNFLYSMEDFILHYSTRRFLCQPGEGYHITDISKGAMLVEKANSSRNERYDRWFSLLQEEINLVGTSDVNIIAVGRAVSDFLEQKSFDWPFSRIIHYSGQAARARNRGIEDHMQEFKAFKSSVTQKDLIDTAKEVFESTSVPSTFRDSTLLRLKQRSLTISRKKLIFNYKLSFERLRS